MAKVPRPMVKQIENIEEIIKSLCDLVNDNKIKLEYYGKDFLEELSEIRQSGLELRDRLEIFKNKMEYAANEQFNSSSRFASTDSVKRVVDGYLSRNS